ncbi:hypothetical protein LTR91_002139 [Friedmanniomyces endolithicus]|uniref:F-box domain-containing protein n=1 Tax=Friedmanniomyces endolithicus TaxID=329885 RepID=A0A4U0VIR7_9PEZI|nr:hypothetical protein LTS09_004697 [Friedmanniomyces endolithicus]KAK0271607.1 hypothetical protein LTR35_013360 [Friedmanniomyces endolithicus]KAK0298154.1 hypothetical protein LTS00_003119 [Friedmanniomyces endolithicus]KAK0323962.1 hypothetical protein LTR82_005082 [Friedmanniomyces endolithicus]KAK0830366.1 hypothetical protein LTR73_003645 [Friedmanniomyces endolithicus]
MANSTLPTTLANGPAQPVQTNMLTSLPSELLIQILSHTSVADIKRLQCVNRAQRAFTSRQLDFLSKGILERESRRLEAEAQNMTFSPTEDLMACLVSFDKHCDLYGEYQADVSSNCSGRVKASAFLRRFLSAAHASTATTTTTPTTTPAGPSNAASWVDSTGGFIWSSALGPTIDSLLKIQFEVDNNEYMALTEPKRRFHDLITALLLHNVSKKRFTQTAATDLVSKIRTELPFGRADSNPIISKDDYPLGKWCVACFYLRRSGSKARLWPCPHDPAVAKYGAAMLESLPDLPHGLQYMVREEVARRTSARRAVEGVDAPLSEVFRAVVLGAV